MHDATAGFKCFRREALQRIGLAEVRSQGYNFQIEVALRCQRAGRVVSTPSTSASGTPDLQDDPAIALEALWRLWQLRYIVR